MLAAGTLQLLSPLPRLAAISAMLGWRQEGLSSFQLLSSLPLLLSLCPALKHGTNQALLPTSGLGRELTLLCRPPGLVAPKGEVKPLEQLLRSPCLQREL